MKRPRWPRWMPVDPYVLLLLGTVGIAALLPARGASADVANGAATAAIT
ncbi:bile acid:sodium symporter, partial [Streptomyces sp. TRM76130]|nr:bile acid:sodium symporter [Streptomyces sp. TRM76130]